MNDAALEGYPYHDEESEEREREALEQANRDEISEARHHYGECPGCGKIAGAEDNFSRWIALKGGPYVHLELFADGSALTSPCPGKSLSEREQEALEKFEGAMHCSHSWNIPEKKFDEMEYCLKCGIGLFSYRRMVNEKIGHSEHVS